MLSPLYAFGIRFLGNLILPFQGGVVNESKREFLFPAESAPLFERRESHDKSRALQKEEGAAFSTGGCPLL